MGNASNEGRARDGYLLLADISGYTAFFTGTELEHAHEILQELTALTRSWLAPPMRFVKLEGDAVFCYADAVAFPDGERFIELIEACYFDVSNKLLDMARATVCRCNACSSIGSLGLKFIAHFGTYLVERDAGGEDLAGPDVILVHRLLKNTIEDSGGPAAYAFVTDACRARLPAQFDLPSHSETYESFGETRGGVHDLAPVLSAMREERRNYMGESDADLEFAVEVPLRPSLAWGYIVDPIERLRWICGQLGSTEPDGIVLNARGRSGAGTTTHCGHGPGVSSREFIDWRPFSYFTVRTTTPFAGAFIARRPATETFEFEPIDERTTRIVSRIRVTTRNPIALLTLRVARPFMMAFWRRSNAALLSIIEDDVAVVGEGS